MEKLCRVRSNIYFVDHKCSLSCRVITEDAAIL
jgi:hypothetical protein